MQRVQTALVKGTTNMALIADLLLKHSNEIPQELDEQIWKLNEDSLVCLGAANWELVQRRREAFTEPQISRHYSILCAQQSPYTDMLFGDNITKQIKYITDDNKVTDKVLDHNRKWPRMSYRGRGNTRGNYNYKYRIQKCAFFRQLLPVSVLPEVILPETQVNCYRDNHKEIKSHVQVHIPVNVAGRIKYFSHEWEKLTSDMVILDMVKGCHITFSCQGNLLFLSL